MDRSSLLLLVVCMVFSQAPGVQTKPNDFVCCNHCREAMIKKTVTDLKRATGACPGSDQLSSPMTLPCVRLQSAVWTGTPLQQKLQAVVETLKSFEAELTRILATSPCQSVLLRQLKHKISNFWRIIDKLAIKEGDPVTPVPVLGSDCPVRQTQNLGQVLQQFELLLQGKVERLARDLQQHTCPKGHR